VKISLEGEDYEPLCVLYMGFTSITIDVPCNGIFNRAHFVKKKNLKQHSPIKRIRHYQEGSLKIVRKVDEKISGGQWGYSPTKWKAYVLV